MPQEPLLYRLRQLLSRLFGRPYPLDSNQIPGPATPSADVDLPNRPLNTPEIPISSSELFTLTAKIVWALAQLHPEVLQMIPELSQLREKLLQSQFSPNTVAEGAHNTDPRAH